MADPLKSAASDEPLLNVTDQHALPPRPASNDARGWNLAIIEELKSLPDVRSVYVSNRQGGALLRTGRIDVSIAVCEQTDLMLAALQRTGQLLECGPLSLVVCTFRGATCVAGLTAEYHACVLAEPDANLGQLVSYMRNIFQTALG